MDNVIDTLIVKMVGDATEYKEAVAESVNLTKEFEELQTTVSSTVSEVTESMDSFSSTVTEVNTKLDQTEDEFSDLKDMFKKFDEDLVEPIKNLEELSDPKQIDGLDELSNSISDMIGNFAGIPVSGEIVKGFLEKLGGSNGLVGKLAGSLKGVSLETVAFKGALIAAAAYGGYQFGQWLSGVSDDLENFNKQLEKSKELTLSTSNYLTKASRNRVSDKFSQTSNSSKQGNIVAEELANQEKELQGTNKQLKDMREYAKELEPTFLSAYQSGKKLWENQQNDIANVEEKAKAYKARIEELKDQMKNFIDLGEGKFLAKKDLDQTLVSIEQMKFELETIGKSEMEIYEIELKRRNLYPELVEEAVKLRKEIDAQKQAQREEEERIERERQAKLTAIEEENALYDKERDLIESLKNELEEIGMTEEEIFKRRLEAQGFNEKTIEEALELQKEINEKKKEEVEIEEEKRKETFQDSLDELHKYTGKSFSSDYIGLSSDLMKGLDKGLKESKDPREDKTKDKKSVKEGVDESKATGYLQTIATREPVMINEVSFWTGEA